MHSDLLPFAAIHSTQEGTVLRVEAEADALASTLGALEMGLSTIPEDDDVFNIHIPEADHVEDTYFVLKTLSAFTSYAEAFNSMRHAQHTRLPSFPPILPRLKETKSCCGQPAGLPHSRGGMIFTFPYQGPCCGA